MTLFALHRQRELLQVRDLAGHGQAEPGAVRVVGGAGVGPIILVEDARQAARRDADPVVADGDRDPVGGGRCNLDLDPVAGGPRRGVSSRSASATTSGDAGANRTYSSGGSPGRVIGSSVTIWIETFAGESLSLVMNSVDTSPSNSRGVELPGAQE